MSEMVRVGYLGGVSQDNKGHWSRRGSREFTMSHQRVRHGRG